MTDKKDHSDKFIWKPGDVIIKNNNRKRVETWIKFHSQKKRH
jgi:hypothetical protein